MIQQTLSQLTRDYIRVIELLEQYEWLESESFRGELQPHRLGAIRDIEQMMIDYAEMYTGQIYDLKHQPVEVSEEEEEESDEALERADLLIDSIRADVDADRAADRAEAIIDDLNGEYDPTSRLDLDEGVLHTTTKIVNIPVFEEDVTIH